MTTVDPLTLVVARIESRLDSLEDLRAEHRRIVLEQFGPGDGWASVGFKEGRRG